MTFSSRRTVIFALGVSASAIFLWLAVRGTNLLEIRAAVGRGDWRFVVPILLALAVYFAVKTLRWKYLLASIATVRLKSLYPVVVVGYASNLFLPAQLGELVRVYLTRQRFGLRPGPVLLTVILERMFDFLTILLFVGVLLSFEDDLPRELLVAGYVCGAVGLVTLIVVMALAMRPSLFDFLRALATRLLPKRAAEIVDRQLHLAMDALVSLREPYTLAAISLTSIGQWLLMGLCAWFAMLALSIDAPLSAAYVVLSVIVVGMTIPSSPGFFGTIQLCFTIGLSAYDVDPATAVAASIYFHGTLFFAVAIGGMIFVRNMGYSPHGLVQDVESAGEQRQGP